MNPIRPILRAACTVLIAVALGLSVDGSGAPTDSAGTSRAPGSATESIDCGGYDEAGTLVDPRAAAVTEVQVDVHGQPQIPGFCGGYTADGTYIGDL